MKARLKTTIAHLDALRVFAATKDMRQYLNCAHAEPCQAGGIILVATDGNRLLVLHDAEGETSGPVIFDMPKFKPGIFEAAAERITIEDGIARADIGGAVREARIYKDGGELGRFPDWRGIVPFESDKACDAVINGKYLADLATVCKAFGNTYAETMLTCGEHGAGGPVVARWAAVPGFAVIMPLRSHMTPADPLPAWMQTRAPKAATETPATTSDADAAQAGALADETAMRDA